MNMTILLLAAYLITGIAPEAVTVWEDERFGLCVAITSPSEWATDVIVTVKYLTMRHLSGVSEPTKLLLSKTITFPVYRNLPVMGDCMPILLREVEKIEVRLMIEAK